jgi:importin subunit beta-1
MRASANILAVIASIELPRNEWSQIVDTLADNCTNQDNSIKNASITTMGYICEQIKKLGKTINDQLS